MKRKLPKSIVVESNKKECHILLKKYGTETTEVFNIAGAEDDEGSYICYDAVLLSEGKKGRLKEFYPSDLADGFTRHSDNRLDYTAADTDTFKKERDSFLSSYNKLREIFINEADSDLDAFIPDFTIYESCDKNGRVTENSTIYIWTENRKIKLFSDFIKELHENPTNLPEHNLFKLLSSLITLSKRIGTLHDEGFLHLDIKPSIFGLPRFKNDILTDNIYLFDINTIYNGSLVKSSGTDGYSAPELRLSGQKINNRSDVYSLGCILFAAVTGNTKGFQDGEYSEIEGLIKESELIRATDATSNIYLVESICNILKKALKADINQRDYSCEDLVADLEKARRVLIAAEYNEPINLNAVSAKLDKKPVKAEVAFLNHLLNKPLYEFTDDDATEINVLLAGFGNHSQRFLDCCLQIGQMYNKKLIVTIATKNAQSEKELYLKNRPALTEFFSVDGEDAEDSYGDLFFKEIEFSAIGDSNDDAVLEALEQVPDYIFISLGRDNVNRQVAESFASVASDVKPDGYSVNYVAENPVNKKSRFINAINLSKPISRKDLTELNRMGLNTHLVWIQDSNYDLKEVKKDFKKAYNYTSSIANAVSIRYKLKSIGIDCKDLNAAADLFNKQVLENEDKTIFDELVAVEHRRWVAEKICKGWTQETKYHVNCTNGYINDAKAKKHVCLVKSMPGRDASIKFNEDFFDNASKKQIEELDELDYLSVNLHRALKKAATKAMKNDSISESYKNQLKSLVLGKAAIEYAYFDWEHCLIALWNKEKRAVSKYKGLKARLEKALEAVDENGNYLIKKQDQKKAREAINNIHLSYYPLLESLRYDDYKKKDEDLVLYIPYILTHKHNLDIVIPLKLSDKYNSYTKEVPVRDIFSNVSAITLINPAKACYVCCIDGNKDIEQAAVLFRRINDYLNDGDYKTKLSIVIEWNSKSSNKTINSSTINELKDELLQNNRVTAVEAAEMDEKEKIREAIFRLSKVSAVQRLNGIVNLSEIFLNDTNETPFFSLDSDFRIHANEECNYLNYIKSNKVLTVSDLFRTSNARGKNTAFPEFFDEYKELFNTYMNNRAVWKTFCSISKEKSIQEIEFGAAKSEADRLSERFYAPAFAFDALKKVEAHLKGHKIIDNNTHIYRLHTDSCVVELNQVSEKCIEGFKSLFSNIYYLCDETALDCHMKGKYAYVKISNLIINNAPVDSIAGKNKKYNVTTLLNDLKKQHLITNIELDDKHFSFCFTSHKSQQLLTQEGAILEMYVYLSCLQSGLFDDVATSYEINRNANADDKNEFDVVLTSGFKSAFIECKATKELEENFYDKLSGLTEEFGMNSKAVLVADKYPEDSNTPKYPETIVSYGKRKHILTIFDDESLKNIAQTLYDILND